MVVSISKAAQSDHASQVLRFQCNTRFSRYFSCNSCLSICVNRYMSVIKYQIIEKLGRRGGFVHLASVNSVPGRWDVSSYPR
jgi:hypothetical protein